MDRKKDPDDQGALENGMGHFRGTYKEKRGVAFQIAFGEGVQEIAPPECQSNEKDREESPEIVPVKRIEERGAWEPADLMAYRQKKDRVQHQKMTGLIRHEINKGVRRGLLGRRVFDQVLCQMDQNQSSDEYPDRRIVQIRIKQDE